MDKVEFMAARHDLVGNSGQGPACQAAEARGIVPKTILRAKDGCVTDSLVTKLPDGVEGIETITDRNADIAFGGAGRVGQPEGPRRDPRIPAEAIVTRMRTLASVMRVTPRRGANMDGEV